MQRLVLGTYNRKKAAELRDLLAPLAIELVPLFELPGSFEVAETGTTFRENAALKGVAHARRLGEWVLGEDSGLEVDALDGAPGVYSARFAGPSATDEQNNARLLSDLDAVAEPLRTARYCCAVVLADPRGETVADAFGYCRGRIRRTPAGDRGFGYDPLFEIPEYHRTFAELGPIVKAFLSHRARALRAILPTLHRLAAPRGDLPAQ